MTTRYAAGDVPSQRLPQGQVAPARQVSDGIRQALRQLGKA